jgi:hypothetical protein
MAEIAPRDNEKGKVWSDERMVEIIEGFGCLQEYVLAFITLYRKGARTARKKSLIS